MPLKFNYPHIFNIYVPNTVKQIKLFSPLNFGVNSCMLLNCFAQYLSADGDKALQNKTPAHVELLSLLMKFVLLTDLIQAHHIL